MNRLGGIALPPSAQEQKKAEAQMALFKIAQIMSETEHPAVRESLIMCLRKAEIKIEQG